jgi:hypothetical protein
LNPITWHDCQHRYCRIQHDHLPTPALRSATQLVKALAEHREQASPRYLLIAAALCALATLAYGLALRGLFLLHRWVGKRSTQAVSRRLDQIPARPPHLQRCGLAVRAGDGLFLPAGRAHGAFQGVSVRSA